MEFTTIEVGADGARGSITLNRPDKLNPLSTTTLQELAAAANWFDERPEVKVVVVSGNGRAFSAGADLGGFAGGGGEASVLETRGNVEWGRRMADAIEGMTAVTVARIHGHCVGGAVVLASACDLRVAADSTRFSIPEVDLGIPLTWGGIPRLIRELGPAMTKELVMTCRPFDAIEAKEIGFVNRVVPAERLDAEVDELVGQLLSKSAFTLSATKQQTNVIADAMVGMGRTWNDADLFITALRDPESRAAAAASLQRVRKS
ncbi:MAG: enoyl-CoA hydratase/isomerase family protein [Actinobacteria bacterium]|nr:enoyl-CoA hydratase/isomerase family protein [Actinomycetota bacterium]